jgi:hypothetical protein
MSTEQPDHDDRDDSTALDPDDYNQTRRLRQIHDARSAVPESRRKGFGELNDVHTAFMESDYRRYVAETVIEYAIELEPIAHRTDADVFDRTLPDRDVPIRALLDSGGQVGDEYITLAESRHIKRHLDRFMAKVGLGVEIDDGDEWEV